MLFAQALPVSAESLRERKIDIYIQALSQKKDYEKIRKVLSTEIEKTSENDSQRLMKLAQYGMENNAPDAAAEAYNKVLAINSGNMTAKRNLGTLLFAKRRYTPALELLNDYNVRTGGDYISNFEQGEILYTLNRGKQKNAATPYYQKALEEAQFLGGGKDSEFIRAKSMFRLGQKEEGRALFAELEKRYPDDIFITTDYAGALYEDKMYDEAAAILAKLPEDLYETGALKKYNLDPEQEDDVIVYITLMRIACKVANKEYFAADKMFRELQAHYPDNPSAAVARSTYYASFSNWRAQLANLDKALEYYKEDTDLQEEQQRVLREHGSFVENQSGLKLGDSGNREFIIDTRSEVRLIDGLRIGSAYTIDFAKLSDVPFRDGDVENYTGIRKKAEVYLQQDFMNGDSARVTYYDQEGIPGVGGSYKLLDYWGDTTLEGAFRSPYWDLPQAIAEKGSKSYIELERALKPTEDLTITGKGSLNSYGLEHDDDLTHSMGLGALTSYNLPQLAMQKRLLGDEARFSLNHEYTYETFNYYKDNSEGEPMYNMNDLHLHSFYLAFTNQFTPSFRTYLSGGCTYDVIANTGRPIYGVTLSYLLTPEIELTATANHVISTTRYFYAGFGVKYSFTPYTLADFIQTRRAPGEYTSSKP